jgi:ABC-type Zn uptake system ZnuABC Zn-binding protein ZnuA
MIRVQSVVPIGGDPHIYEPTPEDVRLIARADLILVNGLTFEGWMDELIGNSGTKASTVRITEGVKPIESEEYVNSSDPHAWMSAKNGMTYVGNVRDALIRLDPENAESYRFNANMYLAQIQDLDTYIQGALARVPQAQRILITSHDAFRYYGLRYGIRVEAALDTSTDAEVQTDEVARLTNTIHESGIKAVFVESTINPKLIWQIAEDNDVAIGGSLYADSLGDPTGVAGTYLKMLRYNTDMIVSGLLGDTEEIVTHRDRNPIQQTFLLAIILSVMIGAFGFMVWRLNRGVVD